MTSEQMAKLKMHLECAGAYLSDLGAADSSVVPFAQTAHEIAEALKLVDAAEAKEGGLALTIFACNARREVLARTYIEDDRQLLPMLRVIFDYEPDDGDDSKNVSYVEVHEGFVKEG